MCTCYNYEGLRVSKTVNGVTTNYYYQGTLLIAEETDSSIIVYLYDENSTPVGFMYRAVSYAEDVWDTYAFEKNIFGDIVAVYSADTGVKLISYTYGAWGDTVTSYHNGGSSTTATKNPYKYRGYYYDSDLAMYYLQTRYYDPAICRFINADIPEIIGATVYSLTDKNLFAYCDNNPVMRGDPDGEFWNYVIGGVVGAAVGVVSAILNDEDVAGITISAVTGAALGVVSASGLGWFAQASISAGITSISDVANQAIDIFMANGTISDYNMNQTFLEATTAFVTSAIGSAMGHIFGKHISKTERISSEMFDKYLEKMFSAGLRSSAGKSSSALLRQANAFLGKTMFWDNVTRGASSVIGSVVGCFATSCIKKSIR